MQGSQIDIVCAARPCGFFVSSESLDEGKYNLKNEVKASERNKRAHECVLRTRGGD